MSRRGFFLSGALAVAIAMSADGVAQNRTPVPDLTGNWAHPFLTGFEPPASGPGPVLNTSRRPDGVANFQQLVGDHTNPILKPHAAEIVKKHGEMSRSGIGYPTPSNQCRPQGVPYILWDFSMQMLPNADHITMVYRQGNETRRIRMNGSHPQVVKPSWYGDSVGRYEGDTLVIDTIGVKVDRYAMLDMYGTPFSEKLHVVERYRLVDYEEAKGRDRPQFQGKLEPDGERCCDRSQLPGQDAAAPFHGRGRECLHHAVDRDDHLLAESGRLAGADLRREPARVLQQQGLRHPGRGQTGLLIGALKQKGRAFPRALFCCLKPYCAEVTCCPSGARWMISIRVPHGSVM